MKHWALKYVGQPWSITNDCYWWFRHIQKNEFNIDLPIVNITKNNYLRIAARLIKAETFAEAGWFRVKEAKEGDAVFMSRSDYVNTHIGIVIFTDEKKKRKKKISIIHALEGIGVIISNLQSIRTNGLKIKGYFSYGNSL